MQVEVLKKVIKFGHIELAVSDGMDEQEAMRFYKGAYPELGFATLKEGRVEDGKMVYEVVNGGKVGTKG